MNIYQKVLDSQCNKTHNNFKKHKRSVKQRDKLVGTQEYWPDIDFLELPDGAMTVSTFFAQGSVIFYLPWDMDMAETVKLVFEETGWVLENKIDTIASYGEIDWYYEHPNVLGWRVQIQIDADKEGSTCKKVKVDTRMIEQDVYEVHCIEDGENITFKGE